MNYHRYDENGIKYVKTGEVVRRIQNYNGGAHQRKRYSTFDLIIVLASFAVAAVWLIVVVTVGYISTIAHEPPNNPKDPTLSSATGKNDDDGPGDGWGDNSSGQMESYGGNYGVATYLDVDESDFDDAIVTDEPSAPPLPPEHNIIAFDWLTGAYRKSFVYGPGVTVSTDESDEVRSDCFASYTEYQKAINEIQHAIESIRQATGDLQSSDNDGKMSAIDWLLAPAEEWLAQQQALVW